MINELKKDAEVRMSKALDALANAFNKIRTGRAHPSLLDGISVDYYGVATPLSQAASISIDDARTLSVTPWEKSLVPVIEKAILKSDLGLNPSTTGAVIRIPLPSLTEETRKVYGKQAKAEAENARIAVRNIRRDVLSGLKALLKDKDISEDEERKAQEDVQKITDSYIAKVDENLAVKEKDLMEI
ncbi:MAG: ribosome recycling factor [Porticoccaceae bacterium]|jgi:ribosome recycling factor|nr:MAG: ribosome-recycling factor [SAR92 bacterium BACL16 MAG-120619-bin48]KRP26207.1 MAG: ribosome-recycling factor [SAR92 bacterium BACL16 MAG-120322-bin99]MDP4654810.1 ribosome recycling factor [Alphaproteobacteria bacterium]MDP4745340.1 ribosome recycling factor [Porticoccaceae bacterium]MDP4751908.1 ribosome recycling factor [Porticoccaceae bacterium]